MTEHPTKQDLDEYRRRVLAPAAFLSVHRHVTACPRCAEQSNPPQVLARDLSDLHAALLSAPDDTPYHLSADEVVAYVQGALDEIDLEIAESHLSVCRTCLTKVERHAADGKRIAPAEVKSAASMKWWRPWRVAAVVSCGTIVVVLAIWLVRSRPVAHTEHTVAQVDTISPQSSSGAEVRPSLTPEVLPSGAAAQDGALLPGTLILIDGKQKIITDKHGTLSGLERLPSPIQQRVRAALQTGRLEHSPALAQLADPQSTLLSRSGNGLPFRLIGPLGQVVRSEQPTFRWRALAGTQSYTVTVTDADLNEIATSPPLHTTAWRISKPLKEGGTYSWQVTAVKDGVRITSPVLPAPQAKFKVIDRSTSEMLQQAQRTYPDSHLTLGVLYAEAGLLDEAEQELRMLVRNNRGARIALKLLQNVKAMRAVQNSSSGRP